MSRTSTGPRDVPLALSPTTNGGMIQASHTISLNHNSTKSGVLAHNSRIVSEESI